jgi:hypothetical protein
VHRATYSDGRVRDVFKAKEILVKRERGRTVADDNAKVDRIFVSLTPMEPVLSSAW